MIFSGDQSAHAYKYFELDSLNSIIWAIVNSTELIFAETQMPVLFALGIILYFAFIIQNFVSVEI